MFGSRKLFQLSQCMMMTVFFISHEMVVFMGMNDCMGMRRSVMCMRERMSVQMRMMTDQSIRDHDRCPCRHDRQSDEVQRGKLLVKEQEGQECSDERIDRVVGTRPGGTDDVLCPYIQEDTESVGDESQLKHSEYDTDLRHRFFDQECDQKRSKTGKDPFQDHDLERAFG